MLIELDYNRDEWQLFTEIIPENCFKVVNDYWEDSEEWCHIEILDREWQQWIKDKHPDWIVDG